MISWLLISLVSNNRLLHAVCFTCVLRADEIPILRKRGYEVTVELFEETGFKVPILVDCKDGLDLTVPPPNFTIQDVENHVGKRLYSLCDYSIDI